VSAVPHSPQNRWPGVWGAPQLGQLLAIGVPQSPQKRWLTGLAAPQLAHVAVAPTWSVTLRCGPPARER